MHLMQYAEGNKRGGKKKYIRLKVYKDRIEQTISNEKIEFDDDVWSTAYAYAWLNRSTD
jgi:hypothetical protein